MERRHRPPGGKHRTTVLSRLLVDRSVKTVESNRKCKLTASVVVDSAAMTADMATSSSLKATGLSVENGNLSVAASHSTPPLNGKSPQQRAATEAAGVADAAAAHQQLCEPESSPDSAAIWDCSPCSFRRARKSTTTDGAADSSALLSGETGTRADSTTADMTA